MKTIKFLDQGQDFLEWIIEGDKVIDCQPFQFKLWAGRKVIVNDNTVLIDVEGCLKPLNHKVVSIVETDADYQKGYKDGIRNQMPGKAYSTSEQYKFGFNVALYNKNLELRHA